MPGKKMKVLLAEDDHTFGEIIRDNLVQAGYEVFLCHDGQTALDEFFRDNFDICLLDIIMPIKDGFSVAKSIRQKTDRIPILFLSGRSMEEDKLTGFQLGADDYITKPFSVRELLLRMDVFIRRSKKVNSDKSNFKIGNFIFSPSNQRLYNAVKSFALTQRESDLLSFLCMHANRILKREELLLNVWGKDDYFLGRSMDVFMTKLRKYFREDSSVMLETIHGVGFRFNADVE
jgi:DNA-binding response OmpR family regulator